MTGSERATARGLAARPIAEGGTPVAVWTRWRRHFPPLNVDGCPALVLVAAHPDDETLGLGATAAMLSGRGVSVQVVAVTDGEAAYPDDGRDRKELAKVRREELAAAAGRLGLPKPIFLRIPDGEVARHEQLLVGKIAAVLAGFGRGTWCAATWRGDGHPDHEATGRAAAAASKDVRRTVHRIPNMDVALGNSGRSGRAVAPGATPAGDAARAGDEGARRCNASPANWSAVTGHPC